MRSVLFVFHGNIVRKLSINDIENPWYTRDFDKCFNEIYEACLSLKKEILN